MRYDADLAAAVCTLLPPPARGTRMDVVLAALEGPPEARNIVLEAAVAAPGACPGGGAVQGALLELLQGGDPSLMPHQRRSAAFILAASTDREVLGWLVDAAVLEVQPGVSSGLRRDDRVTLYDRIARSSVQGFRAAAERVQGYGAAVEEWEWEDVVPDISGRTVRGRQAALPEWLPLAEIEGAKARALVVEKQRDAAAARIVCGRASE